MPISSDALIPLVQYIPLGGRRCLVLPRGGRAEVVVSDGRLEVVSMSPGCRVTDDGYLVLGERVWPGAARERLHPWPPPAPE